MEAKEYHLMHRQEDEYWWYLAKREFIKAVLPMLNRGSKILDIGAGTGGTTQFLSAYGQVTAVENNPVAVSYLKKKNLKYIDKSIENCEFENETFDLICLFDVLYHQNIINEKQILAYAYRWLKPEGHICITDSAVPWLYSRYDLIMHARKRYKRQEMIDLLTTNGFVVKKASYMYFFLFPLFFLVRTINKKVLLSTVPDLPPLINRLFLQICKLESRLLRWLNFPIGSSIIALAQKPKI